MTFAESKKLREEQFALEEECGVKVEALLGVLRVVQALPACIARSSIRRRALLTVHHREGRFAVHHLIPIAFATHDILWKMKGRWELNDPAANGLVLPITRAQSLVTKLPYHVGPHPQYSRCIEEGLNSMAQFSEGWTSDELSPLFTDFVSYVRNAVLALPPEASVNDCCVFQPLDLVENRLWRSFRSGRKIIPRLV